MVTVPDTQDRTIHNAVTAETQAMPGLNRTAMPLGVGNNGCGQGGSHRANRTGRKKPKS